jgi:hypothetical protein
VIVRVLAATIVLAVAFQSVAQTPAPSGAVASNAPKAEDKAKKTDPIICKTSGTTGTRLTGTRVCLPESVWAQKDAETRDTVMRSESGQPH